MVASQNEQLRDKVLENLLTAHKRLSHSGNPIHLIILTRYLLRLIHKRKDKLVDFVSERDE